MQARQLQAALDQADELLLASALQAADKLCAHAGVWSNEWNRARFTSLLEVSAGGLTAREPHPHAAFATADLICRNAERFAPRSRSSMRTCRSRRRSAQLSRCMAYSHPPTLHAHPCRRTRTPFRHASLRKTRAHARVLVFACA
jgi:hypothetical protein